MPLALRPGQILPQIPAALGVRIHMLVDALLAHHWAPLKSDSPLYHLRGLPHANTLLNIPAHLFGERAKTRTTSALYYHLMRLLGPIPAMPCVPPHLPRNGARCPSQKPRNRANLAALLTPFVNVPALFPGHVTVSHVFLLVSHIHEEHSPERDLFQSLLAACQVLHLLVARAHLKVNEIVAYRTNMKAVS